MIQIENLSKSYGTKKIFNNFSISGFDKSDKIGIIGENGIGKSTLLKLIYGLVEPDFGIIKFDIKNPLIAYMSQELEINNNLFLKEYTILEYLKENSGYNEIEQKIDKIYNNYNENLNEELGILQKQFEKLGGYDFERIVDTILLGLTGEKLNKNTKVNELSGGQKSKVLLTEALLKGGDILLLDEPTNNLDIESINWLIDYIEELNSLIFIVSHDKYLLNQVTNKTLELGKTEIKLYSGNYEFYEIQKELEQNQNDENYNEFAKKYGELKKKISKEYGKKSSLQHRKAGPDTDPRRKFGREYAQNSSGGEIRRYKKELEILLKNKPEIEKKKPLNFDLSIEEKVFGGISANNIEFKYPNSKNGISAEKFSVQNGEKVAIFGSNASGKTTFLKLLTGELKLQKGEIKISPNIKIGNYSQEKQYLEECELNLIEFLEKNCKDKKVLSLQHNVLKKFNFSEDDKKIKVSLLSPGQKNRLLLALFSLVKYNTIILDEPTNHLDLEAIDELEKTLQSFNGNLIVVSHDRGFMSEVNFNKKYEAKNGKLIERL